MKNIYKLIHLFIIIYLFILYIIPPPFLSFAFPQSIKSEDDFAVK